MSKTFAEELFALRIHEDFLQSDKLLKTGQREREKKNSLYLMELR